MYYLCSKNMFSHDAAGHEVTHIGMQTREDHIRSSNTSIKPSSFKGSENIQRKENANTI